MGKLLASWLIVAGLAAASCAGSPAAPPSGSGGAPPGAPAAGAPQVPTAPASAATSGPLTPVSISFSAFAMANVPLAIAKEAGYFEELGLEVNVLSILSSAQNTAALVSGEVDVSALGGVGPIRARMSGGDLTMI